MDVLSLGRPGGGDYPLTSRRVDADNRRGQVRERYAKLATVGGCCTPGAEPSGGCGDASSGSCSWDAGASIQLGYSPAELAALPAGANLGLGCGNPTALLSLKPGQVVLDLGSGAGIDCFLAAKKVGLRGRVIGVDMTPEMLSKARANAQSGHYRNVEFRLGEIEHLPVEDGSVDVIISNCVINLAPDKGLVYREAFRALRPGGYLAVSDVVATRPITKRERGDPSLWSSCSSGALATKTLESLLQKAGFTEISVDLGRPENRPDTLKDQGSLGVVPANIRATKPAM